MKARSLVVLLFLGSACSSSSAGVVADSGAPDTGGYGYDAGVDAPTPPVDSGNADSGNDAGCPAPAWDTTLVRVDAPGPKNPQFPHVGFDAAGNAVALWEQADANGLVTIWSATRNAQGTWSAPVQVDAALAAQPDASAGSQTPPASSLAVSANGTAIAAWQEETNGSFSLPYAAVYNGSTWGAPTLLHSSAIPSQTSTNIDPRVAILPNGDGIVAFGFDDGTTFGHPDYGQQIYVNRYTGGAWSGPGLLSAYSGNLSANPDVALDASGNAVVVWDQVVTGGEVNVTRIAAGSTTGSTPAQLDTTANTGGNPRVAVDASGNATVVWAAGAAGAFASRVPAGSVQGTETQLDSAAQSPPNAAQPLVAVDANGNVTAVWRETTNDPRAIWANHFSGGAWSGAVAVEANAAEATDAALAVDEAGDAMAVWTAGAGIKASFFSVAGGAWGAPVVLDGTDNNQDNPDVAFAHGCPKALAVWKDVPSGGTQTEVHSDFFH